MHATVYSGTVVGVDGLLVEVEVDLARGIPSFSIVGLPNTAVRESRERVTAAIKNSGWEFPLERITVNLAPADVKKEGSAFDLPIAAGMLVASDQVGRREGGSGGSTGRADRLGAAKIGGNGSAGDDVRRRIAGTVWMGELALDGSLRRVKGVLPVLLYCRGAGFSRAVIPAANFGETLVVDGLEVFGCRTLRQAVGAGVGAPGDSAGCMVDGPLHKPAHAERSRTLPIESGSGLDFGDVVGQESVKRALTVAAAGGHHALMVGPPGAGKTMLARRFPDLLPPLTEAAAVETTMIYSIVGMLNGRGMITRAPFRCPHHSASDAGLIGGGPLPRPGEVTLAHNGVLFLDELPEFRRNVLEAMREPIEEGRITVARAGATVTFPARFQLVAAMNPCPCGYHGSSERQCRCSPLLIERYRSRVSGPLLDRVSIHVAVRPVGIDALAAGASGESSASVRRRVCGARNIQRARLGEGSDGCNARIPEGAVAADCPMTPAASGLLLRAQQRLCISARGRAHAIRVARTIADLDESEMIEEHHVAEAVQYRAGG